MKITATIITHNEESNIRAACESVAWADEILVIDSESTDTTREVAANTGAQIVVNPWPGFAAQKQLATDKATHDWVFSLDADERVSDELRESIRNLITSGPNADGYRIARRTFYQKPLDTRRRMVSRLAVTTLQEITRSLEATSHTRVSRNETATPGLRGLRGDLLHYTVRDAADHHRMIGERYAPLAARQMFDEGRRTSAVTVATAAPAAFIRSLIFKGGFRDGLAGITIANFAAHHAFLKHLMLWEMQSKRERDEQP